jgi:hypothetical protein
MTRQHLVIVALVLAILALAIGPFVAYANCSTPGYIRHGTNSRASWFGGNSRCSPRSQTGSRSSAAPSRRLASATGCR